MSTPGAADKFRLIDLIIDIGQRQISRDDERLSVSRLPFTILRALLEAAPNVVTYDELIGKAWGPNRVVSQETVAQHIKSLRRALGEDAANPRYIESVRGEGYRLLAEPQPLDEVVAEGRALTPRPSRRGWVYAAAGLGAVLIVVLLSAYLRSGLLSPPGQSPLAGTRPKAIVVFAFSEDGRLEAIDDVGTEIATRLRSGLDDFPELDVISELASRNYANSDVATIREALVVDFILSGALVRNDRGVVATPRLIDAATGIQVWSSQFDASAVDMDTMQTQIIEPIGGMVTAILQVGDMVRLAGGAPTDVRAIEEIGRWSALNLNYQGSLNARRQALGHLQRAISYEPDYATTHALLAVELDDFASRLADPERALDYRMQASDEIALARDLAPDQPFVLTVAIGFHLDRGEWHEAAGLAARLIETAEADPVFFDPFDNYGRFLRSTGQIRAALRHYEHREGVRPFGIDTGWNLAQALAVAGDFNAAYELAESGWQTRPNMLIGGLSAALAARDRTQMETWLERIVAAGGRTDLNARMWELLDDPGSALDVLRGRLATARGARSTGRSQSHCDVGRLLWRSSARDRGVAKHRGAAKV